MNASPEYTALPLQKFVVAVALASFSLLCRSVLADDVDYLRDIKPLLESRCGYCHGAADQKSSFRVDAGKLLIQGGDSGPAVISGNVEGSLLMKAVLGQATFARMPLDDDPLSADEIGLLKAWIQSGANYPADEVVVPAERVTSDHWSFQPVTAPPVPMLHSEFVRNPIDAFVLEKLLAANLKPSAEAERRVLIRRVTLDLVGLVPSPEEVEAFLADQAPDAYERLVDRLLSSPHVGERWGRHWLDGARYADSNGFTIDGPRSVWSFRDWVIRAINSDMPFNQFTIEQLAGDMLPNATVDQRVATGFHRNTLANEEGGTDDEQFRNEAMVDRINTTGAVWLGLTVGCAQCHDHKYDPVSQRDYYRLFAVFNNTADNNDANGQAPKLSLPSPDQVAQQNELQGQLKTVRQSLRQREATLEQVQAAWESNLITTQSLPEWQIAEDLPLSTDGQRFERVGVGAFLVTGPRPDHDTYQISLPATERPITGVRLETLTHDSLPQTGPGTAGNGNFVLSDVAILNADGRPLPWGAAKADHSQEGYGVAGAIDGNAATGWAINTKDGKMNVPRSAVFALKEPAPGGSLTFVMHQRRPENQKYLIGSFRVSVTSDPIVNASNNKELSDLLTIAPESRTDEQRRKVQELHRQQDTEWSKLKADEKQLQDSLNALNKSIPTSLVMEELPVPRESYIHIRGDFLSKGAAVTPGTPQVLPEIAGVARPTRLDFAKWLVNGENPLTARVTVNRVWLRLFGMGLVETENDFGLQGSPPTHPELLDWLSSEFVRNGWSLKELQRLIVTSATYRQSSIDRADLRQVDPRNLLLGRQNRIRLEAEIVRDATLSACGLLAKKLYGPPVYPPQPEGIYVLTQNRKDWPEEKGEDRYRRSLYTYFWRSSPHPMFPTFDAPDATTTCTRRNRSNTPLQALTLANDRGFVELAQGLAARVLREGPDYDEGKLRYAGEIALGRSLSDQELERFHAVLEQAREFFGKHAAEARLASGIAANVQTNSEQTAAWVAVARVLTNLDEFYTRE